MNGEKVSSTLIRGLLKKGDVEQVNHLLGRPLSIYGKVIEGAKRGKSLGYPTANLAVDEQALLPKPGIYAVKISYKKDRKSTRLNSSHVANSYAVYCMKDKI